MKFITTTKICYFLLLLAILKVVAISGSTLSNLPSIWQREEYSHGFLLPVIAFFIGWHSLAGKAVTISPSWTGVAILSAGLLLSAFGDLAAFQALLNYSFVISLFGIVLAFFGKDVGKRLLPSFILLLFALPLPEAIVSGMSVKLQLVSSVLGAEMIRLMGFPVFQDGNIIDLGTMKLQVAEACNGLRYLFPLMSLGFLVAFLMEDKGWKRIIVFASSIPISIFLNILRIAMIGVTVNVWGQEMAEGLLHIMEGFVVFGICLVLLISEATLFLKLGKSGRFRDEYFSLPAVFKLPECLRITPPVIAVTILCFCFSVLLYSGALQNKLENTPVEVNLSTFPVQVGDYLAKRSYLSPEELDSLHLTDYWLADYTSPSKGNSMVNLYIAYYDSQRMRASIHMPINCIVGSGWEVAEKEKRTVITEGKPIPVVRMVIRKQDETVLVYYWLEQRGRQINDIVEAKMFLAMDSITIQRTDGALVRLVTPVFSEESMGQADERLKTFLNEAYPSISNYIPGRYPVR